MALVAIKDCTTGEEVLREETAEEITAREEAQALIDAQRAEAEAAAAALAALKESARAKLVAGQPLTEEEAATIVI